MLNNRAKPEKKEYARQLRRNPSDAAYVLWQELRSYKLGVKFRRRSPILGYIPAFYCPAAMLVVEVNGPTSDEHVHHDDAFNANGLTVLRLAPGDIKANLPECVSEVCKALRQRPTLPTSA